MAGALSTVRRCWKEHGRSEEHTSELQSQFHLVCRLLLEKKKKNQHKNRREGHHNDTCVPVDPFLYVPLHESLLHPALPVSSPLTRARPHDCPRPCAALRA